MNLDNPLKIVFPQEANQSALKGFEMPRFVGKKTVDEVWREKQRQQKDGAEPQRKARLGEMTLEDFLVKAGVETDGSDKRNDSTREPHWKQRQSQKLMLGFYVPSRSAPLPIDTGGSNAILPSIYPDGQVNFSSPLLSGRKRVVGDEMGETAVERRRKRMIKNRESAARSRARKQARIFLSPTFVF